MLFHPLPLDLVEELRALLARACVGLEAVENPNPELVDLKTALLEALLATLRAEAEAVPSPERHVMH